MTKAAPHCPMFFGFDPKNPILNRPTTATPPPNIGLMGAFFYYRGLTYDPCDPPFIQTFCFGYYFTVSWCFLALFAIKALKIEPKKVYSAFMFLGVLNYLVFLYNLFTYYLPCEKCSQYQFFIDLVPNIQAHFWTSDYILINVFMIFVLLFASARFDIPNTEVLYLLLLSFITTPAVGGMKIYMTIEEYYEKRKTSPNKVPVKNFLLFLAFFSVIMGVDFYYLTVYSRRGLSVFPADYDPRTNFQLLLYYEAYMTPAVLLEAMTIFICYASFPLLIITNLPKKWNILVKLVISGFSILTSFAYVAAIMGFTIIGYEALANFWPEILQDEKEKKKK